MATTKVRLVQAFRNQLGPLLIRHEASFSTTSIVLKNAEANLPTHTGQVLIV